MRVVAPAKKTLLQRTEIGLIPICASTVQFKILFKIEDITEKQIIVYLIQAPNNESWLSESQKQEKNSSLSAFVPHLSTKIRN